MHWIFFYRVKNDESGLDVTGDVFLQQYALEIDRKTDLRVSQNLVMP